MSNIIATDPDVTLAVAREAGRLADAADLISSTYRACTDVRREIETSGGALSPAQVKAVREVRAAWAVAVTIRSTLDAVCELAGRGDGQVRAAALLADQVEALKGRVVMAWAVVAGF